MKFTIARETLLAPLQQVIGVIEKRQTLPILSNVLLRIKEGQIELTGTDLEVQLITRGPIDTNESVEVTVPARKLLDKANLPHDMVIKVGHVVEQILGTATAGKFDMVVMGSKGRSGLSDLVLGSVAQRVCALAKQPVVLVK